LKKNVTLTLKKVKITIMIIIYFLYRHLNDSSLAVFSLLCFVLLGIFVYTKVLTQKNKSKIHRRLAN